MAGGSPTHDRGRRAGASAPPTPQARLGVPPAMAARLEKAIIIKKGWLAEERAKAARQREQAAAVMDSTT